VQHWGHISSQLVFYLLTLFFNVALYKIVRFGVIKLLSVSEYLKLLSEIKKIDSDLFLHITEAE
jgi:hypothetical protein